MRLFSDEERRGLVVALPLILAVLLLSVLAERREAPVLLPTSEEVPKKASGAEADGGSAATRGAVLRAFDPNTAEYEELRSCGVPPEAAAGIVRWRRYGKVYRMKEDVALCSGVGDSLYAALKPYIMIGDDVAARPRYGGEEAAQGGAGRGNYAGEASPRAAEAARGSGSERSASVRSGRDAELRPFSFDTVSAEFFTEAGFSPRQAEAVLNYRDAIGGIRSEEQLRRCYVVSERMAARLLEYAVFPAESGEGDCGGAEKDAAAGRRVRETVEINTADSAALRSVAGIGEKSVTEIMRYRELLGGFVSVEQLAELEVVTESNYERILTQIRCDSCKISKIDINFADPKTLARHPYVSSRALRRIVKQRQLKGGWSGIGEMVEDDIFTEEEAVRLAPYLRFGRNPVN